jgi:omega-6 fatty acid desaturase (delta-12 desaturase)
MSVRVLPARLPQDVGHFMRAWRAIYRDDPAWVPPLRAERARFLDPQRNPFFRAAHVQPFLAWRGRRPVGTIAATFDLRLQEKEPGVGLFGLFEFEQDREVAASLLQAASSWLQSHGAHTLRGPYNLGTNHEFGLRVAPFDGTPPTLGNPHNRSYYPHLYEELGLTRAMDWYAYQIDPGPPPPALVRLDEWLRRRHRVEVRPIGPRRFEEDCERFWSVFEDAWSDNWGHAPMDKDELLFKAASLRRVLDPRLAYFVYLDGELAGVSVTLPDYNQVLHKLGGSLWPLGWRHLIYPLRHVTRLRALVVGVRQRFQKLPVGVPLYLHTWEEAMRRGVEGVEVSLVLQNNVRMRGALEKMGGRITMTYRAYEKPIPPRESVSAAVRPFAREDRRRTWLELAGTVLVYGLFLAAALGGPLLVAGLGSIGLALTTIRLFIFLHDAEHGAIFRGSPAGQVAVKAIGVLTLLAPSVWREFHDHHHATLAEPMVGDPGAYRGGDRLSRVVDVATWRGMDRRQRLIYRATRHPLTLAMGWLTAFAFGACVAPFLRDPRRGWPGLLVLAAHLLLIVGASMALGPARALAVVILPAVLSSALGAYLFYAQHNAPGIEYDHARFEDAALRGATFLAMPGWMHWFTGNIGYHHVHHLNPKIPFYRLPEVMAAVPALQSPVTTTLRLADLRACLSLVAWDPERRRLVTAEEA